MKNKIFIILGVFIIVAIFIYGGYVLLEEQKDYYTQIDNTKVKELKDSDDDMKYEYTLVSYDKKGYKKEFKFKTVRILKDKAYLKLDTMLIVGVRKWEEVKYDELPKKVQVKYVRTD